MHLTRMRLGDVPPFTEPVEFHFDERVNVFVGPNASGKSTVLLALAEHFKVRDEASKSKRPISNVGSSFRLSEFANDEFDEFVQEEIMRGNRPSVIAASEDWFGTKWEYHRPKIGPAVVHIESVREVLPGISEVGELDTSGDDADDILQSRFTGLATVRAYAAMGKKLWEEDRNEGPHPYARVWLMDAGKLADNCSKTICGEVILDGESHNYIPDPYALGYLHHPQGNPENIKVLRMMGINSNDVRNFESLPLFEQPSVAAYQGYEQQPPIYLGHMSSGTEGHVVVDIRWLALQMLCQVY